MDASPLAKLPPELRNNIFDLVVIIPNGVHLELSQGWPQTPDESADSVKHAMALMRTCKQIRQECFTTFFTANTFTFATAGPLLEHLGLKSSTNLAKSHAALVRSYLGEWEQDVDDQEMVSAELAAWVIDRFDRVFRGTGVRVTFNIRVLWTLDDGDTPPLELELRSPFEELDLQAVSEKMDSVRDSIPGYYEEPDDWSKKLFDGCVSETRALVRCLRQLRDPAFGIAQLSQQWGQEDLDD